MDGDSVGSPPEADSEPGHLGCELSGREFPNKRKLGAGWRLLFYAAMFFVLWSASNFFLAQIIRPVRGVFSPGYQFWAEFASFVVSFFAAWVMSQFEELPVGAYGLPARGASGKLFCQGCLFGSCEICLLIGLIAVFGGYAFGSLAQHGAAILKWGLYWGLFFVVVGLFEEFFFRGYTLHTLAEGIGFWPAAVALSLFFGAVHFSNSGEGWIGAASVAFVGLFWSFTVRRTGNLWFALGMHATFDFGETFLFSVPDSGMIFPGHLSHASLRGPNWVTGGTAGPEASVFDFLILALFFLAIHFLYPARGGRKGSESTSQHS